MINITATVESIEQAKQLIHAGVDTLYFGEEEFGLRLPKSFSREQQKELVELAHHHNKTVTIAVNRIMHPEHMKKVPEYVSFLEENGVDQIAVGDAGIIHLLRKNNSSLNYIFDAQTMVTSAKQINFWAKRGAIGAVVAREVPYLELKEMAEKLAVFGEILVYGATCIHQSKRPLLKNYFSYIDAEEKDRGLFLAEPNKEETHYSIYEDSHGTHIFADNDVNLITELDKLCTSDFCHWKLDGIYTAGKSFVAIAERFVAAKNHLEYGTWNPELAEQFEQEIISLHPSERGLDKGFFLLDPSEVK